jgi:hypothetical protein
MPATNYGRIYAFNAASGVMAAGLAANSEILQVRHVDATELRRLRVLAILLSASVDATGFTAGAGLFDVVPARAWTAAGTGGGTLTLTGNNGKLRTTSNTNILGVSGEIRVATTAALTAGTKTLDAQGIAGIAAPCGAAGTQIIAPVDLLKEGLMPDGDPLFIGHQEGFVIRASVPAVGTWKFAATIYVSEATG